MTMPHDVFHALNEKQRDQIQTICVQLARVRKDLATMGPPHRMYSLAITKIEEAELWLHALKNQAEP